MKKVFSRGLVAAAVCAGTVVATAPAASAAVVGGACTKPGSFLDVCISEIGPTAVYENLYEVQEGQDVQVGSVAAYLDGYRIGTRVIPCVTPVVNGAEQDVCGTLGLTRASRTALVPHTEVGTSVPTVAVKGAIYVCEATLRAMVAGFGEEGKAIFTLCATDTPQFVTN